MLGENKTLVTLFTVPEITNVLFMYCASKASFQIPLHVPDIFMVLLPPPNMFDKSMK